ncbi:uncharacterized protein [Solanum lycopersicum]|uniref:uncharacterized protein n=1 Tax=Solanum lycopersicum TaxID=4081 RepID=UPI0037498596
MSVEEYCFKYSNLCMYASSVVYNARDEMSRFVTGVAELVIEECLTAMLHDDMTLTKLLVYAQSIEESKLTMMARSLKRSCTNNKEKTRFKKRAQTQEDPKSSKVKLEKGGSSQKVKPTCTICGKKHYGECLLGTGSFFGCGKEGHKGRDCPMIASRGREGKQVAPSVPKDDAPTKRRFYALRAIGEKPDESDDDVGKLSFSCCNIGSF